jgi:hypothetical protein
LHDRGISVDIDEQARKRVAFAVDYTKGIAIEAKPCATVACAFEAGFHEPQKIGEPLTLAWPLTLALSPLRGARERCPLTLALSPLRGAREI